MIQTSRTKRAEPSQGIWGGGGKAEAIPRHRHGMISSFGSIRHAAQNILYGIPVQVDSKFYIHFLVGQVTGEVDEKPILNVWLSYGPNIDKGANPELGQEVLTWLQNKKYKTYNIKKKNSGSFIQGELKKDFIVEGNCVQIAATEIWLDHFENMMKSPGDYWGLYLSESEKVIYSITMIRDCHIHLNPLVDDFIRLEWEGIYTWESNDESLWVQDDNGFLIHQIRIPKESEKGFVDIPLNVGKSYVVTFPGYSFRNYSITMAEQIEWVIEPAKLHFVGWLPKDSRYYFTVYPGEKAYFCMKDYGRGAIISPFGAIITKVGDSDYNEQFVVEKKNYFYEYDSIALPISEGIQHFRVDLVGEGRAAFWLDGIPNIFSDRLSWYKRPVYNPGRSTTTWPDWNTSVGHYPNLGHYMPYVEIPEFAYPLLTDLKSQCANIYTFANAIQGEAGIKEREKNMREYMSKNLQLERDYTILANSGRVAVVDYATDPDIPPALDFWIENIASLEDGKEHYLAAADEPNLNYPTYEEFEAHFTAFANHIRNHPLSEAGGVKIAAVASSRFDHGTTVEDSVYRLGETWCANLVEKVPHLIDAIVWHDWTVRGLLNLRQYADTVEAAYKYSDNGRRRLAIEQTNTSGGSSVSLYDQNTHFAVLWWASIFINTARTGKLDDLMWFPTFDELTHPKGLIYYEGAPEIVWKPVAYFHAKLCGFLYGYTDKKVHPVVLPHIEMDCVGISNEGGELFLAVNKGARNHTLTLQNFDWQIEDITIEVLNNKGVVLTPQYTVDTALHIIIPPEGVLFVYRGFP